MKPLLVISSFPDAETARQIGTTLVRNQLAACVNIVPGIESIFSWKGEIETGNEVLALIKTTEDAWPLLEEELRKLHPYEVPEIIALDIERGSTAYLEWMARSCGSSD